MKIYSIFIAALLVGLCRGGKRKAQGKMSYTMNWVNGMTPCENFENEHILVDMKMEKDSPLSTVLAGQIEFTKPIIQDTVILIVVDKETPQGKVLAYTMEIPNLCDHVTEKDMPWTIFIDAMNLDPRECPLPANVYKMDNIKLNLAFAKDIMNHETVGEYKARIELMHKGDGLDIVEHDIACYQLGFTVDEVREKSDE